MAYNQKQQAGRGNMMKTGKDIPVEFYGPQMTEDGPGDGIMKKLSSITGTTHRGGLFGGRQMAASSSQNTDLLEVASDAISSGVEKVKGLFKKKNKPTGGR
jgi:hypothetical protein